MDNNKINDILSRGFNEIDNDLKIHEEIREVAKTLAQRLMWEKGINEYITDEYGNQAPYTFMLENGINATTGTPTIRVYVINVYHMEQASKIQGKQYKPAKYEAVYDGTYDREQVVQTLLSTAIASIKGVILIDELEE